eukprot:1136632-Alexandrium_andersonii.AAC.1
MRRRPGSPAGPRTRIQRHSPPASARGPSESIFGDVGTASERRMLKGLATAWAAASSLSPVASASVAT